MNMAMKTATSTTIATRHAAQLRARHGGLVGLVVALVAVTPAISVSTAPGRFRPDDPLRVERDHQDAVKVEPSDIDLAADIVVNLFGKPGDRQRDLRAQNINTIDEVPDSSWFVNRAGSAPLTSDDVARGPNELEGPAEGTWEVIAGKTDGVTPGFTVRDSAGVVWFLKFDAPGYRTMATGAEVAVTKLLWALGYHVPENHIAALRPETLTIAKDAKFALKGRPRRAMRRGDIDAMLRRAESDADGSYRVVASRALPGKPLGGFRFHGTRPDDPNDIVPHEHRRELRGYGVFAAWLNHVDAKAINSLDTLITEDGRSVVRHHLLDFGSTLGSAAVYPRQMWEGYDHMVEPKETARGISAFGFHVPRWRRIRFHESPAVGRMPEDNSGWDPTAWKPRVPNPAFLRARPDDRFWAARKLAAITNGMIRAAIREGRFRDEASEAFLVKALVERRNAILRAYLPVVNPIVDPALGLDGVLAFENAAVSAGVAAEPPAYRTEWGRFDNVTGIETPIGAAEGPAAGIRAPAALPSKSGEIVQVSVAAPDGPAPWRSPVTLWFRRSAGAWELVGLDRAP